MKIRILSSLILTVLLLTGCSNQWRDVSPSLDNEEMLNRAMDISSSSLANQLLNDERTAIYFAEGPDKGFGPVHSVVSLLDLSFFGLSEDITVWDLESATVVFLDGYTQNDERRFVLIVEVTPVGQSPVVTTYEDRGYLFTKDEFVVEMASGSKEIVLRSYDLSPTYGNELAGVIQLQVGGYYNGQEQLLGKFSTLFGMQ